MAGEVDRQLHIADARVIRVLGSIRCARSSGGARRGRVRAAGRSAGCRYLFLSDGAAQRRVGLLHVADTTREGGAKHHSRISAMSLQQQRRDGDFLDVDVPTPQCPFARVVGGARWTRRISCSVPSMAGGSALSICSTVISS